ncbi:MAG: helix-turn-helix domain-containing protein, partial [Caulobacterales bacterium]|nr:helix-turn-helix domain-containing protein [Caulobacterales bacterium]
MADQKLFAGSKIRRFRKGLGLTQTQMASELDVSASYLNLIERDQRPVSARVLLRLADTFDLDLRGFAKADDAALMSGLKEAASDPLLEGFEIAGEELKEL